MQNDAAAPALGKLQDALSNNNSTKDAAAAADGVWGYDGTTLTKPTMRPPAAPHHPELTTPT